MLFFIFTTAFFIASGRCRRAARRNAASAFLKILSDCSEVTSVPIKLRSNSIVKLHASEPQEPINEPPEDVMLSKFLNDLKSVRYN